MNVLHDNVKITICVYLKMFNKLLLEHTYTHSMQRDTKRYNLSLSMNKLIPVQSFAVSVTKIGSQSAP